MGGTSKSSTHIKSEAPATTEMQVKKQHAVTNTKPQVKTENAPMKPTPKPKSQAKSENATDDNKVLPNIANVANPLFGRTGSADMKEEEACGNIQVVLKDPPKTPRARSEKPKAVRARKGKAVYKLVEVTKQMKTELEKDEGVVVDATILAEDGAAVLQEGTFDWTHLLHLRSNTPFRLVKSTILRSGPHATHVAILLRQETPFRLLALPLHIRTKILNYTLKHHEPSIPIAMKQSAARTIWSPTYRARFHLAILQSCKQIHAEAAPLMYGQTFTFPGTPVVCDFLLRIGSNRRFLRSLRSETYVSLLARTVFHLLADARHLERLSFAHVSSNEMPKTAVKNIWHDAATWLSGLDRSDPCKGLEVLAFDEQAFHMRERDKEAGGFRVLQWGPAEQLEFTNGLKAKMVAEGKRLKKAE